ncbi:unnamed protein product [Coffea canephora]|uniref:Aminotransferase class I/classII large domain-containing protein n=1 Tax=Coffea canephora TaxID=49390 RepID=A0A068UJV6_COFCA|nr:unnamed protein product [Coffea canephora]
MYTSYPFWLARALTFYYQDQVSQFMDCVPLSEILRFVTMTCYLTTAGRSISMLLKLLQIIKPNPCGNVYTRQHLEKIAETAKRLGIAVISDEVYGHLAFGDKPFVPMGVFGSVAPVFTLGSLLQLHSMHGGILCMS